MKEEEKRCWFCGRTKKDLEEARIIGVPDVPKEFDTIELAEGYQIDVCPVCRGAISVLAAMACLDHIDDLKDRIKDGLDEAAKAVKDYL